MSYAVPASGPSTPRSAPSSSAAPPTSASGPSSPSAPAPAAPTTPSDPATTAPSPTAIATEPTTITPSATGTVHGLTAVFNNFCSDFGFDVTNNTAVAHTVHIPKIVLDLGNTLVGAPVVVSPGATSHVPLPFTTQAGTEVQLVDETGAVILTEPIRFCVSVENLSATVRANTSYTLNNYLSITLAPPLPRNGVVASDTGPYPNTFLRYTPDPASPVPTTSATTISWGQCKVS